MSSTTGVRNVDDPIGCFVAGTLILKTATPDIGLVYSPSAFEENRGIGIDFSDAYPQPLLTNDRRLRQVHMDLDELDEDTTDGTAVETIAGQYALALRKVYNLEVEENHTYFVGRAGVLVQDHSLEAK